MLAFLGPHIARPLFPSKKKGTQAFGSYPRVFFDFHPPCHVFSAEMHLPTFRAQSVGNATLKAIAFYLVRMARGAEGRTVSGSQSG